MYFYILNNHLNLPYAICEKKNKSSLLRRKSALSAPSKSFDTIKRTLYANLSTPFIRGLFFAYIIYIFSFVISRLKTCDVVCWIVSDFWWHVIMNVCLPSFPLQISCRISYEGSLIGGETSAVVQNSKVYIVVQKKIIWG